MIRPEPEPYTDCQEFYTIDPLGYCLLLFGAGVGWFVGGYLLGHRCWKRTPEGVPILAQPLT